MTAAQSSDVLVDTSDHKRCGAIAVAFLRWWPVGRPLDDKPCRPAPGTAGFSRNPSRIASYSRLCYAVDITVHDALRALALRSTRYFTKTELSVTVAIERLSPKDNPRIVVLAGAMLLVASKEPLFLTGLRQLASGGVGEQRITPAPLTLAKNQSLFQTDSRLSSSLIP